MQQIHRRTSMPNCDFALQHGGSPVNLLHIFRTPFPKNTSGWLLLVYVDFGSLLKTHLIRIKCWQSFLRENLTIVRSDFVSRRHACILSSPMSKPILLKTLHTVCSKSFDSITSTHSRREYWAFAQHCLSVFSSCVRRLLFAVFTVWTSDSSLFKLLFKSFICTLREKCPNTEFFVVRIFLYSDWIQKNTDQK